MWIIDLVIVKNVIMVTYVKAGGVSVSLSVPLVYYLVGGWDTQQFKLAANQRSAFN